MSEPEVLPKIGTPEFWELYDKFVCYIEFPELLSGVQSNACAKLREILRAGHKEIARLPRPEKDWHLPMAWLVLRNEQVISADGSHVLMQLEAGDVMLGEPRGDRAVFVTHSPIIERSLLQFLGQRWPGAKKGVFLPLYDKETLMKAVRLKANKNATRCLDKAEEVAQIWG